MTIALNCPTCGNNLFGFPKRDEEAVRCQVCGASLGTLAEVKQRVSDAVTNRPRKCWVRRLPLVLVACLLTCL